MRTRIECMAECKRWLDSSSEELISQLKGLTEEEIVERFFDDLEFGTGGMRGKLGAGTNRMNIHTIAKATQGFSEWLKENYKTPSVAIAYDTRNMSREFAKKTAQIFSGNNIQVYLFDRPMPTPVLSYAVRELGCSGGVVITASHNPAEYNGYKVYTHDGVQAVPFYADKIIEKVKNCDFFVNTAEKSELISAVPDSVLQKFEDYVIEAVRNLGSFSKKVKVVYTPLHGKGNVPVTDVLRKLGHTVLKVEEQSTPDGDFPTVSYPNPENPSVFKMGLKLAEETSADLVIATDPDCDRMGVMVKNGKGYSLLTGNQMGIIFTSFIIENLRDRLPEKPYVVKTIVSTDMVRGITEKYGVELRETLTGFKYIGEIMEESIKNKNGNYLFGFEESYGCLYGTHARDKDAVVAAALAVTAAAALKEKGLTLLDYLEGLYKSFGYYREELLNSDFEGLEGMRRIASIMRNLRSNPPIMAGDIPLSSVKDYEKGLDNLPPSDVVVLTYGGEMKLIGRPSGTEPKIKFYLLVSGKDPETAEYRIEILKKLTERIISL